jgi:threonyl-tRNA synthetase
MRELQERYGYEEVSTPILVSHRVWQTSGHWDYYRDNMFVLDIDGQPYSLKPMNCPESTFIYKSRLRSYRDLPIRYAEYGRLHRNERSGALSGLTRVRQFIQDDGHVYVRPDQLADEIGALLAMVREAYGWFGLEPRYTFATKPDGAIGDAALWERAEGYIREALERAAVPYTVKPKDGTFYAPKIDIYIDDALGREWQMATIQADLTMLPDRFDLTYIDEHGQPQRPIAIHRAIYGSLERLSGSSSSTTQARPALVGTRQASWSSRSPTATSRRPRSPHAPPIAVCAWEVDDLQTDAYKIRAAGQKVRTWSCSSRGIGSPSRGRGRASGGAAGLGGVADREAESRARGTDAPGT